MNEKLLKSDRLKKSREFKSTFDHGRKYLGSHFVLFNDTSSQSRIGLVVSKKVGNAVVRNRVKRMIREWYRRSDRPTGDLVVLARARAGAANHSTLVTELNSLSQKIKK